MREAVTASLLGLVEEATRFLPVSSTGHPTVAGALLGVDGSEEATFAVAIQLGAILAVVPLYRDRVGALFAFHGSVGFSDPAAWAPLA